MKKETTEKNKRNNTKIFTAIAVVAVLTTAGILAYRSGLPQKFLGKLSTNLKK